jgi:hypothetical protein
MLSKSTPFRLIKMSKISIAHALPAFIIVYEDRQKGGQHVRVICESIKNDGLTTRHEKAVCVYSSHVDALIDAEIHESLLKIKHRVINLSAFDFSEMYDPESQTLPIIVHWCWGAKEQKVLYRRNGCPVSIMNFYELPVNQDTRVAELTVEHEGLKIYHNIRGRKLSAIFLDEIGISAHTQHGQFDCKRTAHEAVKAITYKSEPFGEVEQIAYYNSARMQWEFKPTDAVNFEPD